MQRTVRVNDSQLVMLSERAHYDHNMTGYLYKKTADSTKWQQRWFVLYQVGKVPPPLAPHLRISTQGRILFGWVSILGGTFVFSIFSSVALEKINILICASKIVNVIDVLKICEL